MHFLLKMSFHNLQLYQSFATKKLIRDPNTEEKEIYNLKTFKYKKHEVVNDYNEYEIDNKDGFKNYYKKAKIITEFINSFNDIAQYTGGERLDIDRLPKTIEDLNPKTTYQQIPYLPHSDTENSPEFNDANREEEIPERGEGTKFAYGSPQYLSILNKAAYDATVDQATINKFTCFKEAVQFRLEYNNCVISVRDSSENLDLHCAPLQKKYETARSNCESHYPMIIIHDAVIEDMFNKLEVVEIIALPDGSYVNDLNSSIKALRVYTEVGNFAKSTIVDNKGLIDYKPDYTDLDTIVDELHNQTQRLLGYDTPQIEE